MSARAKICQIVPTTFQGISIGSVMLTSTAPTAQPRFGMHSATRMPSGTSISSTTPENTRFRTSAREKRPPMSVAGSNRCWNHSDPFQKNEFCPIESCTE